MPAYYAGRLDSLVFIMFLSYNLLKQFCEIKVSANKLAELLTAHSFEVEEVKKVGDGLDKVVVGEVLSVEKHANADRLNICKVKVSKEILQIICGAPNVEAGQKVPVALSGATLPHGMKIEKRKVRGVESNGMICAQDELGLGDDHEGIMVLDSDLKTGENLSKALGLKDYIIEVENKTITNRPDLWGHLGVAREISAILNSKFKYKDFIIKNKQGDKRLEVKIDDYKLCPRYLGVIIENIKLAPSPQWLKNRLWEFGIRSVNNVVDITNYVMVEIGQPMHAFDIDKLSGLSLVVRRAKKGEEILALDKEKYALDEKDLVIADKKGALAIAGVMGGELSAISNNTKSIILESANFEPINIRKTSTKLHLRSESSMRFEKGLDPHLAKTAISRAIELLIDIIPDIKINKIIDNKKFKLFNNRIKISLEEINNKTGINIAKKDAINILKRLGFEVGEKGKNFAIKVPSWRATGDIKIAQDIIEEIVRVYGYNNIKPVFPAVKMEVVENSPEKKIIEKSKDIFSKNLSMSEVYNYSFNGTEQLKKLGIDCKNYIKLTNPASEKQNLMRQSLIPNLLNNIYRNIKNFDDFSLFEIGCVYLNKKGENKKTSNGEEFLPKQDKMLSGVLIKKQLKEEKIFYKTKEIIKLYLKELGFYNFQFLQNITGREAERFNNLRDDFFHPTRSVLIKVNNKIIGIFGEMHPLILSRLDIKNRAGCFELNISLLSELVTDNSQYKELFKFPAIERDFAFVLDKKILYNKFIEEIKAVSDLVSRIELFDVYDDEKILGKNKKSLAIHIDFRSPDKTLTSQEADIIQEKIIKKLAQKFGAKIR